VGRGSSRASRPASQTQPMRLLSKLVIAAFVPVFAVLVLTDSVGPITGGLLAAAFLVCGLSLRAVAEWREKER
jgi:hypothetical protein